MQKKSNDTNEFSRVIAASEPYGYSTFYQGINDDELSPTFSAISTDSGYLTENSGHRGVFSFEDLYADEYLDHDSCGDSSESETVMTEEISQETTTRVSAEKICKNDKSILLTALHNLKFKNAQRLEKVENKKMKKQHRWIKRTLTCNPGISSLSDENKDSAHFFEKIHHQTASNFAPYLLPEKMKRSSSLPDQSVFAESNNCIGRELRRISDEFYISNKYSQSFRTDKGINSRVNSRYGGLPAQTPIWNRICQTPEDRTFHKEQATESYCPFCDGPVSRPKTRHFQPQFKNEISNLEKEEKVALRNEVNNKLKHKQQYENTKSTSNSARLDSKPFVSPVEAELGEHEMIQNERSDIGRTVSVVQNMLNDKTFQENESIREPTRETDNVYEKRECENKPDLRSPMSAYLQRKQTIYAKPGRGIFKLKNPIDYLDCPSPSMAARSSCNSKLYFETICSKEIEYLYDWQSKKDAITGHSLEKGTSDEISIDKYFLAIAKSDQLSYKNMIAAEFLLQLGANINTMDNDKNTALNLAVKKQNILFLVFLLSQENLNPFLRNSRNENSLYQSIRHHVDQCLLIEKQPIWIRPRCSCFLVAKFMALLVCVMFRKMLASTSTCIWPGYRSQPLDQKLQGFCIVAQYKDNSVNQVDNYHDIPVIWRRFDQVSTEGIHLKSVEGNIKSVAEFSCPIIEPNVANVLFKNHRHLCIVSPSIIKSNGYGSLDHNVTVDPTIALYCHIKGVIPIGETSFPEKVNGYRTDVREGYCRFGHGGPKDYLFNIKMGCCIGTRKLSKHGTLGGFVDYKGKLHFITSTHVLSNLQELKSKSLPIGREVIQPGFISGYATNLQKQVIGKVTKAIFSTDNQNSTSVDAALVEVTARLPVDGSFPSESRIKIERAGYTLGNLPKFETGELLPVMKEPDKRNDVLKFGAESGLTLGSLKLEGTHVRMENDTMEVIEQTKCGYNSERFKVFGQYEVYSKCDYSFFALGDSGSFVFSMKDNKCDKLQCIGMAIGQTTYGSCIVTPIADVLKSLGLPEELKILKYGNVASAVETSVASCSSSSDQSGTISDHSDEDECFEANSDSSGIDSASASACLQKDEIETLLQKFKEMEATQKRILSENQEMKKENQEIKKENQAMKKEINQLKVFGKCEKKTK